MSQDKNRNQGFVNPRLPAGRGSFDNEAVQQPVSLEQRLGLQNYSITSPNRAQMVEDANAEFALARDFTEVSRLRMAKVPFAIPIQGEFTLVRADYNTLANYQYVQAAADLVGAFGRNDQDQIAATNPDGGRFNIICPSAPNFILGFVLEWSLQLQTSSAFNMQVQTSNFKGISYQSLDRTFAVRIGGGKIGAANGGILAFLFAQRTDANTQGGYYYAGEPGLEPYGSGGMMQAIVQPARIMNYFGPSLFIPGVTLPPNAGGTSAVEVPEIDVTVPTNLADGFSVIATPITAASPWLAGIRRALSLDGLSEAG